MKKILLLVLLLLILIGGGVAYFAYQAIFSPNVLVDQNEKMIAIPSGSTYNNILELLESDNILQNTSSFDRVASWMNYKNSNVASGLYTIKPNWSNKEIISLLRSGRQTPVKITYNNVRTKEDLAGKISSYLELDSLELTKYFQDSETHKKYKVNNETFLTLFIPNTYEFFWNVKKDKLLERLVNEHDKFWAKEDRLAKAEKMGYKPQEVYTLAAIVEKESQRNDERSTIAGLYLNRLEIGMPLQADPTVVFANGDFELRRVLNKHLAFKSPYNTYLNAGLPPGPIYMPSIRSIDAVLNRKNHNYLYMCAKPEVQGAHLFASSLSQHNANARRYHRWLNSRGIR